VARPPEDFDEQVPPPPPDQFEPESLDPLDEEAEPTEWYRRPVVLIGWGLMVLILIALIVYGIIELIHGNQGTTHAPSTSTTPTTTATSTATTPPRATTTTTPPTSSAGEPPQQPTQQQTEEPTHRHHLPPLPPVITIPGGPAITVPPGLR
jgi:hypothetical protein